MRILGVDTASEPASRGYAIVDSGRLAWFGKRPPPAEVGPIDVVAGERPWTAAGDRADRPVGLGSQTFRRSGKLRGEALITFCVNNGFQLRDAWPHGAPLFVALKVRDWKDLVFPGHANMQGDAFCMNVRQKFAPHVADTDILDAIGIAIAASRFSLAQLKRLQPKGFRRS